MAHDMNMKIDEFPDCSFQVFRLDEIKITAKLLKCPGFSQENGKFKVKNIYVWFGGCFIKKCQLYIIRQEEESFVFESVLTNVKL